MKYFLLTFDLEEYERAGEKGFDIGHKGGEIVQKILERTGITATFFVTASFYRRYPGFVKELSEDHEIAFHGLSHQDDYKVLPEDVGFNYMAKGKHQIEEGLNQNIEGFRAPKMRPPSYKILKRVGFLYSSSLHPTYVPGRYNNVRSPRSPFVKEGVLEIPVSVTPIVRLPLSWVWFRQLGTIYTKVMTLMITDYLCIYFHPWEFVPLYEGGFVYTRNTGRKMVNALEKFLNWISSRAVPVKMGEFAQKLQGK